jgi:hypothetical protein
MVRSSTLLALAVLFAPARALAEPTAEVDAFVRNDLQVSGYKWAQADLNGDGEAEQLVYATDSSYCGSGGCTLFILQRQPVGYRVVLRSTVTWLPIRLLATSSHGWRDVAVEVAGGGVHSGTARLQFDGNKYADNPTLAPRLQPGSGLGTIVIGE